MKTIAHIARKDVWSTNIDQKLFIEIVHWGIDRENPAFEALNNGKGIWNYYILIPERIVGTKLFEEELWLPDIVSKFFDISPERVSHNYLEASFTNVDWHGGVTYYEKQGHTVGHRSVKIGCDFSHLFDMEHGYDYTLLDVLYEAQETAKQLIEKYKIISPI